MEIMRLRESSREGISKVGTDAHAQADIEEEHVIVCRACGHGITTVERMRSMCGQHAHTFTNPGGIVYRVGCFWRADGCTVHGTPTLEFTWFDGFAWAVALCANCLIHLGWFYRNEEEGFFGLILDRLSETARTH